MSNLSPVSSIDVEDAATLKRDSESGVRLMQTAIFTVEPRSGLIHAEVSRARWLCHGERTLRLWRGARNCRQLASRPILIRAVVQLGLVAEVASDEIRHARAISDEAVRDDCVFRLRARRV